MDDFTIKLGLDNSGARRAAKDSLFDFKKLADGAKEAARIMDYEGNRAAKDIADAAAKAAKAQSDAADQAKAKWRDGFKDAGLASAGFLKQLIGLGTAVAVFRKIEEGLRAVKEVMDSVTSKQDENVSKLSQARTLVRDIAAMQGTSATDAYVRNFLKMTASSGMDQAHSANFFRELVGSGEAVKGNIAEEGGYQKYSGMLGRFAALQGGGAEDAGTYGRMGGILLGMGKYGTAEDALAANMTLTNQISAGVGNNPELARQAAKSAGVFMNESGKGRVGNATELGALIATASRVNPEDSAERLKISSRLLYGFNEEHGGLLKQAGIKESDKLTDAMEKLFKVLERAESSGRNVSSYLSDQGVSSREKDKIVEMYNYRGFMRQQLAVAPVEAGQVNGILSDRFNADPGIQMQSLQNRTDAEKIEVGMMNENRQFVVEAAKRRLEARGMGEDSAAGAQTAHEIGIHNFPSHPGEDNTTFGFRVMLDEEVAKMAAERGLKVPGRPDEIHPLMDRKLGLQGLSKDYTGYLNAGSADAYETLGSTMRLSDPSLSGGGPKGIAAMTQAQAQTNQLLADQNKMIAADRPRVMAPADPPRGVPR